MGKIIEINKNTIQPENFENEPTMTMEEIHQYADSVAREIMEHPERHTPGAVALIELAKEFEKVGDSEFEMARLDKRIKDVMEEVGPIKLPGPSFNRQWREFTSRANQ